MFFSILVVDKLASRLSLSFLQYASNDDIYFETRAPPLAMRFNMLSVQTFNRAFGSTIVNNGHSC